MGIMLIIIVGGGGGKGEKDLKLLASSAHNELTVYEDPEVNHILSALQHRFKLSVHLSLIMLQQEEPVSSPGVFNTDQLTFP